MYTRSTDKRIPPTISVPENYGGSTFASLKDTPTASHDAKAESVLRTQSKDTRVPENSFPLPSLSAASPETPPGDAQDAQDARDATHSSEGATAPSCADKPNDRAAVSSLPFSPSPPPPSAPSGNRFLNIGIGAEELLLIGVMALILFGDERDDELLVCLLLVLLI